MVLDFPLAQAGAGSPADSGLPVDSVVPLAAPVFPVLAACQSCWCRASPQ
jgi:hypothetical protein